MDKEVKGLIYEWDKRIDSKVETPLAATIRKTAATASSSLSLT